MTQPHRRGVQTHLQLSLAYERKRPDFQCRFKEISSFEGGTGEVTFPRSWLSSPPWKIRSSKFHLFLEKVWMRSDSKFNKPRNKSQHQKRS
jgi:hypothetical protein